MNNSNADIGSSSQTQVRGSNLNLHAFSLHASVDTFFPCQWKIALFMLVIFPENMLTPESLAHTHIRVRVPARGNCPTYWEVVLSLCVLWNQGKIGKLLWTGKRQLRSMSAIPGWVWQKNASRKGNLTWNFSREDNLVRIHIPYSEPYHVLTLLYT